MKTNLPLNKTFLLIHIVLLLLFVSCTTAKTYYVQSEDNGYTVQKISDEVYLVRVKSRNVKDTQRLQDMFYLQAAEIARKNGFKYFFTVEKLDNLDGMDNEAEAFKKRILTAVIYEHIVITGYVKLLEKRSELAVKVYDSEEVYNRKYYLIKESQAVLGTETDDSVNNTNNLNEQIDANAINIEPSNTSSTEETPSSEKSVQNNIEEPLELNLFDIE